MAYHYSRTREKVSLRSLFVTIIATILFRIGLVTLAVEVVSRNYSNA